MRGGVRGQSVRSIVPDWRAENSAFSSMKIGVTRVSIAGPAGKKDSTGAGFALTEDGPARGTGRLTREKIMANNKMIRTVDKMVEGHASGRLKKLWGQSQSIAVWGRLWNDARCFMTNTESQVSASFS